MNNQPTPSPGHELCERTDLEASHFYYAPTGTWMSYYPHGGNPDYQHWQKPVKVAEMSIRTAQYINKLEKELAQTRAELMKAREDLKGLVTFGSWPAPISTKDRLPTEMDANAYGYVLVYEKTRMEAWTFSVWSAVKVESGCLFWITPPPIPQVEPVKDEAEEAWDERFENCGSATSKDDFMAGFKAGKEAK